MSNSDISLQRFLVPTGWKVDWHQFYEVDPNEAMMHYFDSPTLLLMYHQHANLLLDMSWQPECDPEGEFIVKLIPCLEVFNPQTNRIDGEGNWEEVLEEFRTRDRLTLVEKIESLLEFSKRYKDPRILKSPGVIDEPSESLRLRLLEEGLTPSLFEAIVEKGNPIIQLMVIDHPDISPDMLKVMMEKAIKKGLRKKATDIFSSRRFRNKHGLD
ncbi:MAG: hypothetical protein R8G66_21085 [Cytophagales bacterium]|nr:hypothetical protein [Cytophagales bacterium]